VKANPGKLRQVADESAARHMIDLFDQWLKKGKKSGVIGRGAGEEEEEVVEGVLQRGLQCRQYPVTSVHQLRFRNRIPVLVTL
jgi:hypothetical protein